MAGRILVVEDDASLARSIVNGLSDEGFHVAHAADGDAALEAVRAEEWDLLILDWWLPGRDGLAVLNGYRREGGNAPVLFVTRATRSATGCAGSTAAPTTTCASRSPSRSCWPAPAP